MAGGFTKDGAIQDQIDAERMSNLVNEGIEREAEYLYGEYVNHVRYSIANRYHG